MKNPIVVFDKNVKASEIRGLFKDRDGDIIINGQLIVDDCSEEPIICKKIYVNGIDVYANCDINVKGDIISRGNICLCNMTIEGSICCLGNLNATKLNVEGNVYVSGNMRVYKLESSGEILAAKISVG